MNRICNTILSSSALVVALASSGQAMAQATWNLYSDSTANANGCTQNSSYAGDYNNSWSCTGSAGAAAGKVTASAWSADRGTTPVSPYTQAETDYLKAPSSGSYYASASLYEYGTSGFGAGSRSEGINPNTPQHAFDNTNPGTQDLLLLSFDTSVILSQIGIGWNGGNDSDITLLRWTGTSAPTRVNGDGIGAPGGDSIRSTDGEENLIATGWQLVGSYADLSPDNVAPFGTYARDTGATLASSWWLISTFNLAANGGVDTCKNASGSTTWCDGNNDTFKLNFVSTKPPTNRVPEPGSLALAGIALASVFGVRRRTGKRA